MISFAEAFSVSLQLQWVCLIRNTHMQIADFLYQFFVWFLGCYCCCPPLLLDASFPCAALSISKTRISTNAEWKLQKKESCVLIIQQDVTEAAVPPATRKTQQILRQIHGDCSHMQSNARRWQRRHSHYILTVVHLFHVVFYSFLTFVRGQKHMYFMHFATATAIRRLRSYTNDSRRFCATHLPMLAERNV